MNQAIRSRIAHSYARMAGWQNVANAYTVSTKVVQQRGSDASRALTMLFCNAKPSRAVAYRSAHCPRLARPVTQRGTIDKRHDTGNKVALCTKSVVSMFVHSDGSKELSIGGSQHCGWPLYGYECSLLWPASVGALPETQSLSFAFGCHGSTETTPPHAHGTRSKNNAWNHPNKRSLAIGELQKKERIPLPTRHRRHAVNDTC